MTRFFCAIFLLTLAAPAFAQGAGIEKGKQIYAAQKCQACHSVAGVGNKKGELDDVGARLKADEIRQWIVAAPDMAPRPSFGPTSIEPSHPSAGRQAGR